MGSWHLNHALTVVDGDGRVHRLVLRRWARPDWDCDDPDYTGAREMTILELLLSIPVPAPVLIGADIDGDECEVPTLLLTRLPGHPPTVTGMAANRFCSDLAQTLAWFTTSAVRSADSSRLTGSTTTGLRRRHLAG